MNYPHSIRLRGPWTFQVLHDARPTSSPSLPLEGKVQMPCTWDDVLGADFWGRIQLERRFNRPGTLSPNEGVWLLISKADQKISAELNGQALMPSPGTTPPIEYDVTDLLEANNRLTLEVEHFAPVSINEPGQSFKACPLMGEVWLEIRLRT